MPIFEFKCKKCFNKFEELVFKNSDLDDIKCPKCQGKEIEKLISVFGFRSTGSNGKTISTGSSCTGCQRTTCAGCK
ncbi:MAG: zinc ribbon domain-containing protein [candidate division WOR-3 bacterium]